MTRRLLLAALLLVAACKFNPDRVVRPGEIRGRAVFQLTDGTKVPAVNADVQLLGSNIKLKTDANGDFLLRNMPSGDYAVRTSYKYGDGEKDVAGLQVPHVKIEPADGSGAHLGTMVLLRLAAVEGVVKFGDAIAPHSKIVLDGYGQQFTDENGHYLFESVFPLSSTAAEDQLKLSAVAGQGDQQGLGKGSFQPKMGTRADVGITVDVPLTTLPNASVSGSASTPGDGTSSDGSSQGQALSVPMKAYAIPDNGGTPVDATLNEDGSFRIDSLPAGLYTFQITAEGYQTVNLPLTVVAGEPVLLNSVILTKADATCGYGSDVVDSDNDGIGDLCDPDPVMKGVTFCGTNPCLNNGVCSEAETTFTCSCVAGYSGTVCDVAPLPNATAPDAPTDVSAQKGEASATVSWTPPQNNGGSGITTYTVTSNPGGVLVVTTGATTTVVPRLVNGTSYTFTVYASNAKGDSVLSAASNAITPATATVPDAPTSAVAQGGDGNATVTWNAPQNNGGSPITGYTVTSTPGNFKATTTSATTAVVTGLANGTSYTFTVHATNAKGNSTESAASNAVTPAAVSGSVPDAPTSVLAQAGDKSATITWSAPKNDGGSAVIGYTVTSTAGGFTASTTTATMAVVTGLMNGTKYSFTVRARNAKGNSAESDPSNVVTPVGGGAETTPDAPTNVVATKTGTSVTVTWNAPAKEGSSPISQYVVTALPSGITQQVPASANPLMAEFTGLVPGGYSFTVQARNSLGLSLPGSSNQVTVAGPPDAPSNVHCQPGDQQIIVFWDPPASDGGSGILHYTVVGMPGNISMTTNNNPAVFTGLSNGTEYTFTVYATNGVGDGHSSQPSPPAVPGGLPSSPMGVRAMPGNGVVDLTWTPPASDGGVPIIGYVVTVFPGGMTYNASNASITITGLTNGVAYSFSVQAVNAVGLGQPSPMTNPVTPGGGSPQTFVVSTLADSGPGSLYQAIVDANASPTMDTITFSGLPASVPAMLSPTTALPSITQPVVIDGSTIPGFTGTNLVTIGGGSNLGLSLSGTGSVVKYLNIGPNSATGLYLQGCTGCVVDHVDASWIDASGSGTVGNVGISVMNSDGVTVSHSVVANRHGGVSATNGSDVTILDNDLTNAGDCWNDFSALMVRNVQAINLPGGVFASGNTFGGNSQCGALFDTLSDLNIGPGTAVQGVNVALGTTNTFGNVSYRTLFLRNVTRGKVTNLDISSTSSTQGIGIYVDSSNTVTIANNVIKNRSSSVTVYGSTDVTVKDNDVSGSGDCSYDQSALQFTTITAGALPGGIAVSGNTFSDTSQCGVRFGGMSDLKIASAAGTGVNVVFEPGNGFGTAAQRALLLDAVTNVSIDGIHASYTSGTSGVGIFVMNSSGVTVTNTEARHRASGIRAETNTDLTVTNNDVSQSGDCSYDQSALHITNVTAGTLPGGLAISGNTFGSGMCEVSITSAPALHIAGTPKTGFNVILDKAHGFGAGLIRALSVGSSTGAVVDGVDVSHTGSGTSGAGLALSNNETITVQNVTAGKRSVGISVDGGKDVVLLNNDVTGSGDCSYSQAALQVQNVVENTIPGGISISGTAFSSNSPCQARLTGLTNLHVAAAAATGVNVVLDAAHGFGGGSEVALDVESSTNVTVEGLNTSYTTGFQGYGLRLINNNILTVKNNVARYRQAGIQIDGGKDVSLLNNDVTYSGGCSYGTAALTISNLTADAIATGVVVSGTTFGGNNCQVQLSGLPAGQHISGTAGAGVNVLLESAKGFGDGNNQALAIVNTPSPRVSNLNLSWTGASGWSGRGLDLNGCGAATLSNIHIAKRDTALYIENGTGSTLSCGIIEDSNWGLYVFGSDVTATSSSFANDNYGISQNGPLSIIATGNWWGASNGSLTDGGSGSQYNGTVNASSPAASAPVCSP